jgi:paraquat-inducible protein A
MEHQNLIACHECELLFRKPPRLGGLFARCTRSGSSLKGIHRVGLPLEGICALTVAALTTFLIAQLFPVIELEINDMSSQTTLFCAVQSLWVGRLRLVAIMVFCSSILLPLPTVQLGSQAATRSMSRPSIVEAETRINAPVSGEAQ